MRSFVLFTVAAFALSLTTVAQTTNSPGTQQASPTHIEKGQPAATEAPGARPTHGNRSLEGCVQSQGGQYVLETARGKNIPLTGIDVSTHSGQEVSLQGNWSHESGTTTAGTPTNAGSTGAEHVFNVTKVKKISGTCKASPSSK